MPDGAVAKPLTTTVGRASSCARCARSWPPRRARRRRGVRRSARWARCSRTWRPRWRRCAKDELARAPAQREAAAGRHYRGSPPRRRRSPRASAPSAEFETAALQVEELQRAIAMREAFLADPANARAVVYGVGSSRALLGGGGGGGDPYDDLYDYYSEEEELDGAAEPRAVGGEPQPGPRTSSCSAISTGRDPSPVEQAVPAAVGGGGLQRWCAGGGSRRAQERERRRAASHRNASVGFADEGPEGACRVGVVAARRRRRHRRDVGS